MRNPERTTINIVVGVLGFLAAISVTAIAYIAVTNTTASGAEVKIPQALIAIASGLTGALGSMLVRTSSSGPGESTPVNVTNAPSDPIPVAPATAPEPATDAPVAPDATDGEGLLDADG